MNFALLSKICRGRDLVVLAFPSLPMSTVSPKGYWCSTHPFRFVNPRELDHRAWKVASCRLTGQPKTCLTPESTVDRKQCVYWCKANVHRCFFPRSPFPPPSTPNLYTQFLLAVCCGWRPRKQKANKHWAGILLSARTCWINTARAIFSQSHGWRLQRIHHVSC